jgi:hypothetical protein
MIVSEAQPPRELEQEHSRLKRLLAERGLEVDVLKELLAKAELLTTIQEQSRSAGAMATGIYRLLRRRDPIMTMRGYDTPDRHRCRRRPCVPYLA